MLSINKKRFLLNLITSVVSFVVNFGVSFFLSPYLVRNLGEEAYGFVPLMNNLINMIQIVTITINSMASRFITVSLHKKDYEQANKYFSSVLIANVVLCLILLFPALFLVLFIDSVFDVPFSLIFDVRLSFIVLVINFMLSICFSVFSVGTFAANRLDLSSIRSVISQCIRAVIIILLFACLKPSIIYVVLSTLASTLYVAVTNYKLTRKLVPQLKISVKSFDKNSIRLLFRAGIWNSVGTLSSDLFTGLDLIIANIWINATAMGVLSVSKNVPSAINMLVTTLISVFLPSLTKFYAKEESDNIYKALALNTKVLLFFIVPILSFVVGFGDVFYSLWMPTLDARVLQILTIVALLPLYISIGSKGLANMFTVYNKIKIPSLVTLGFAACSTISVFILLRTTRLGIYAIAGVSSLFLILKEAVFVPLYAAKCMEQKALLFYKNIIKSFFVVLVSLIISCGFRKIVQVTDWKSLILCGAGSTILICIAIALLILRKKDYLYIRTKLKSFKS